MADTLPGNGFWGWLGRQIGHVKHAVKTDVTHSAPASGPPQALPQGQAESAGTSAAPPPAQAPAPEQPPAKVVVYRDERAEEVEHPQQPGVILRRTTIDEVIVDPQKKDPSSTAP